ncbi:helix-turn-helix transcriptional regulator [Flavobacterium sp.]|jgi:transcriptional regulator with XRE-family HTH domain|uniref:helix-turn-helix domain-containing protein n=1 Tax=Flavobacterium sp. TaxID=239 RepID=UPI0022CBD310|nr:helix-turn-helix transcriptional regulator [Flavobacterium sp.]MCZ8088992.1 helix-turn-helix transcriptional regulator [Flavobacterium sp.]
MNIGDNIRKHRIEKDKKQQEIYEAIGVNQSTYSKIENNKYKMDIETLKNIANVLEVDVTKLIGEDKIEINHTNNDNSHGGSGIIVNNNHSEDLILSLKEQIILLTKINSNLEQENTTLKDQLKNLTKT